MGGGDGDTLLYPHRESARWGGKYPDMSGSRAGPIQKSLLELGLGTGQVWCTKT
jgi:hypothetical protein